MGDFFGGLRSGIQFPQVVMNQGPLPGSGGLPAPLHDTADARINYNSSLLGDLTPYAYGEPGYLSSQNAYLNIPHKIQKIVPVVFLPEARSPARNMVDVSHPVDDADIAFVLRLNRSSMFCTGLKNSAMQRAGLGTAIDPLINLCTLNYILSGMQMGVDNTPDNLWVELLMNLDKARFGKNRNYGTDPITMSDVLHVARACIKPFGIVRGSEKQGGQDEATLSAATWPVSFVVSLTIDGKESNVLNIWHHQELHAGNDLVLRFKPCPVRPYTLNHYYKSVKRQAWDDAAAASVGGYVWQLVPDLLTLEMPTDAQVRELRAVDQAWSQHLRLKKFFLPLPQATWSYTAILQGIPWQNLGYWHIGRSQVQTGKYGEEEYWHNDLANSLRTNHLDITFQPYFQSIPRPGNVNPSRDFTYIRSQLSDAPVRKRAWSPSLTLERMAPPPAPVPPPPLVAAPTGLVDLAAPVPGAPDDDEPDWLGRLEFSDEVVAAAPPAEPAEASSQSASKKAAGRPAKRGRGLSGSLLKADGTSEASLVGLL